MHIGEAFIQYPISSSYAIVDANMYRAAMSCSEMTFYHPGGIQTASFLIAGENLNRLYCQASLSGNVNPSAFRLIFHPNINVDYDVVQTAGAYTLITPSRSTYAYTGAVYGWWSSTNVTLSGAYITFYEFF